jgi:uncharacterized protein YijF (DUF1287 family)
MQYRRVGKWGLKLPETENDQRRVLAVIAFLGAR